MTCSDMKNKKLLLTFIVPLMLTSCSGKEFIKTNFYDYHGHDVAESEFDTKLAVANDSLGIAYIDYENTSYVIDNKTETTVTAVKEYTNGKVETKNLSQVENSLKYNHSKSVFRNLETEKIVSENDAGKLTLKQEKEYIDQVYKKTIVKADKQKKIFYVVADFSTYPTFASYARMHHQIPANFVTGNKETFAEYVLEDVPTKYYVNDNVFTSGIEYSDRQMNTPSYERKVSVSAVKQIVVEKNKVTINKQYEIKNVEYNFSDEYKQIVNYNKITTETKFMQVLTLEFGGKVSANTVDIDSYSQVSFF